jgi:hypothetical protein
MMRKLLFAAAFTASVPAFATLVNNDRITTNETPSAQGTTPAQGKVYNSHGTTGSVVADGAGGGESHDRNGSLTVADSAGGGESNGKT